jgi:Tfp pilus assembly protein PilP
MKLTTGILAMAITMTAGAVWAQNPDAIDNARSIAKSLQQKQANDTNAALDAAGVPQTAKPAPGAPAPAVKPAVIPGTKPAVAAPAPVAKAAPVAKPAPAAKPAVASGQHNQLQGVNVVPGADSIRIELRSSEAVTPQATKLDSPARILVSLPGTVDATPKNHIAVGNGGVKGVRIGMDGKTPPTTSVVVDLEKGCAFELTPGPSDKLVLTVHGQAVAKSNPAPAKTAAPAAQAQTAAKAQPAAVAAKASPAPAKSAAPAAQPQTVAKVVPAAAKAQPVAAQPAGTAKAAAPSKPAVAVNAAPKPAQGKQPAGKETKVVAAQPSPGPAQASKSAEAPKPQPKPEEKKWAMNGKRDPFFSPVVQASGSGCATGKKCLEIGNINLRGVVKSENGFIAVVTNNLNKAYFLRENDPVFNGYVVKITGDSVVFQETVEDKLGKPFTREVVKRLFTPAV